MQMNYYVFLKLLGSTSLALKKKKKQGNGGYNCRQLLLLKQPVLKLQLFLKISVTTVFTCV